MSEEKLEPKIVMLSIKSWRNTDKYPCPNCGKKLAQPYLCTDCNIKIKPVMNFDLNRR